jgi:hypothetical protein
MSMDKVTAASLFSLFTEQEDTQAIELIFY